MAYIFLFRFLPTGKWGIGKYLPINSDEFMNRALAIAKLRSTVVGCLLLTITASVGGQPKMPDPPAIDQFETRCGRLSNPTPANIWLYDRNGEWTIGAQGGYQLEGDWDWPEFKPGQRIKTNAGDHGYGRACLQLRVDQKAHRALEIKSARPRPLAACRQDQTLKKLEHKFK